MTSAQRSDSLPRAEETGADPRTSLTRVKESLSSVHASLLAKHASYAVLVEIAQEIRRHQPSQLAKQAAYSLLYAVPSALIVLVSLAAIVDKNTGAGVSEALRSSSRSRPRPSCNHCWNRWSSAPSSRRARAKPSSRRLSRWRSPSGVAPAASAP